MPKQGRSQLVLKLFLFALALCLLAAGAFAVVLWSIARDPSLPRIYALKDYRPKQVTRILASDGKAIGELFEERRTYAPLERIAPKMIVAIIDAEDADFRNHAGLDFRGMLRAFLVNLRAGKTKQGASTIKQQVVKTFLLSPERTLRRKLQEIILARRLESALTKDEILTLYLNQIYFGHGRYGVEEAARVYFGKNAFDLNVGEAALLAGLPQSPESLSPLKHPEAAKRRQTYVLSEMVKNGHLSADEAKRWVEAPIEVVKEMSVNGLAPELIDVVRNELSLRYGDEALPSLGLTVRTSLDREVQVASREALESGLRAIDSRHGYRDPITKVEDSVAKLRKLNRQIPKGGPRQGEAYEGLVLAISDGDEEMTVDLGGWKGAVILRGAVDARYNLEHKAPSARFSQNDLVRVRLAPELGPPKTPGSQGTLVLDQGPQGAVVCLDVPRRRVLAMVGGYAYEAGQFNRALRAQRQPGSAFKPIVYAAALDTGRFTAASLVDDAPDVYDLWKPKNFEKDVFRGPVRLREALAHSINTVAIRVFSDVGAERVIELAHDLGIDETLPSELSLALGSGSVRPIELTNAFATFAGGGKYIAPSFVVSIGDEAVDGGGSEEAVRPEVAYLVTSMMQSVIEEGTAAAARKLKGPLAGKTGTSSDEHDAWFVGYSPDRACGVWVGFDDRRSLGAKETGAKAALPIWMDVMKVALRGQGNRMFKQPQGIVVARIDKKTGKLAPVGASETDSMDEVFLDGTVPIEVAPAPGEVDPSTFVLDQLDDEAVAPQGDD